MIFNHLKTNWFHFWSTLFTSFRLFFQREGFFLAAGVCFFFFITFIPLLIFIILLAGELLGNLSEVQRKVFALVLEHWPQIPAILKNTLEQALQGVYEFPRSNWKLWLLFAFFSTSFFVSIQTALGLILHIPSPKAWSTRLKSLGMVALSTIFLILVVGLFPALRTILTFVLENLEGISQRIDFIPGVSSFLNWLQRTGLKWLKLISASWFIFPLTVVYFRYFFSFVMRGYGRPRDCWGGALLFGVLLVLLKSGFWYYVEIWGTSLERNHGPFSVVVVSFTWIYLLASAFLFVSLYIKQSFLAHQKALNND